MRLAMQSKKKEGFCRLNMSKMRKVRNICAFLFEESAILFSG